MEYQEHYEDMEQRNAFCDIATSNGFRMLHDNFDEDWKRGDELHGTLIFIDEEAPQAPSPNPARDPLAEIDEINAKLADYDELKVKIEALEKK